MKIIDLLNKIANGEEVPRTIKIKDEIWKHDGVDYRANDDRGYLFEIHTRIIELDLNEEIEIIEEDKKIRKLDFIEENTFMIKCKENSYLTREEIRLLDSNFKEIGNKINEIIDKINGADKE